MHVTWYRYHTAAHIQGHFISMTAQGLTTMTLHILISFHWFMPYSARYKKRSRSRMANLLYNIRVVDQNRAKYWKINRVICDKYNIFSHWMRPCLVINENGAWWGKTRMGTITSLKMDETHMGWKATMLIEVVIMKLKLNLSGDKFHLAMEKWHCR